MKPTAATVFVFLSVLPLGTTQSQLFTGVGDLPGGDYYSVARGISGNGQFVVGGSISANGAEAFIWNATTGMMGLGDLPGGDFGSDAWGVSYDGSTVVGTSALDNSGSFEAFKWSSSTGMVALGDLAGGFHQSIAFGISSNGGVIVGQGSDSSLPPGGGPAFRWTEQLGLQSLGFLAGGDGYGSAHDVSTDGSVIVGNSRSGAGNEAFRWTAATGMVGLHGLPGGDFKSNAFGMSADGTVVVGQSASALGDEAYIWTAQTGMVGLGDLEGGTFDSLAFDVSADGSVVVGRARRPTPHEQAFVWTAEYGMQNLRMLLAAAGADIVGWRIYEAYGVSDDGTTVTGVGRNPSGHSEGWVATIPPPPPEDVNHDQEFDCLDVDALVAEIVSGQHNPDFDFTSDGLVNQDDLDRWLVVAGAVRDFVNGFPLLPGDANLDSVVDGSDFGIWNANKFTSNPSWCSGDFNADGVIDGSDFGVWNQTKFTSSGSPIPEPSLSLVFILLVACAGGRVKSTW